MTTTEFAHEALVDAIVPGKVRGIHKISPAEWRFEVATPTRWATVTVWLIAASQMAIVSSLEECGSICLTHAQGAELVALATKAIAVQRDMESKMRTDLSARAFLNAITK